MREPELVCVIMPAFNVADFVEEAVRSVEMQAWPNLELIFIDDGSTDNTAAVAERLAAECWTGAGRRMRVLRQTNAGAAAARNTGLRAVGGTFILFADADDRLHSGLVTRLVDEMRRAPALDIVFPQWRYVDAAGRTIGVVTAASKTRFSAADLMQANPIHTATGVLIRAGAARATGAFDETLKACIDLDYWVRIAGGRRGCIGCVPDVLADYRKRPDQITGNWRRMEQHWTRVVEKMRESGCGLSRKAWRQGRALNCVYWATIAYDSGDYRAARGLMREAWRRAPHAMIGNRHGIVRTLACIASLLPSPVHASLRQSFGAAARQAPT